MKNLLSIALTGCAVFALCGPVSGDILIDDFGQTTQQVFDPPVGVQVNTDEDAMGAGEGDGKTRYVNVDRFDGTGQMSLSVNAPDPQADYQAAITGRGSFTIGYDGTVDNAFTPDDATGLNLDLTGTIGLAIRAVSDLGAELLFTLYDGTDAYEATLIIPATLGLGSLEQYVLLYSSFVGPGTLDLTNIDAISIASSVPVENGQDVTLADFRAVVPEPASMLLLALGGIGCAGGVLRRRRMQRAAA